MKNDNIICPYCGYVILDYNPEGCKNCGALLYYGKDYNFEARN